MKSDDATVLARQTGDNKHASVLVAMKSDDATVLALIVCPASLRLNWRCNEVRRRNAARTWCA